MTKTNTKEFNMLRRTFAKTLLVSCSLPFWPFPQIKEKISNSELIKRLLKERKDFCIITEKDGLVVNIIRQKRRFNFIEAMNDRLNTTLEDKKISDAPWKPRPVRSPKQRWHKLRVSFGKKPE